MLKRGRGDQQIGITDREPSTLQVSAKDAEALHDRLCQRQETLAAQELAQNSESRLGVVRIIGALVKLSVGDQVNGKAIGGQGEQGLGGNMLAVE
jgi:hypothetical protein